MSEICVLGIDPGISGAVAFYFPAQPGRVAVEDVPVANKLIDGATLATRLEQMQPDMAIVELVGSMPRQGLSSTFNFGRHFGTVIGIVQARRIPLYFVTPAKWMAYFRLKASEDDAARALALRLFPAVADRFSRKKDHGRADAALIARWGAETICRFSDAATGPVAASNPRAKQESQP